MVIKTTKQRWFSTFFDDVSFLGTLLPLQEPVMVFDNKKKEGYYSPTKQIIFRYLSKGSEVTHGCGSRTLTQVRLLAPTTKLCWTDEKLQQNG